ncbi:hypothetical protein Hanom_Chr10g00925471 [Helianthus anomalus]
MHVKRAYLNFGGSSSEGWASPKALVVSFLTKTVVGTLNSIVFAVMLNQILFVEHLRLSGHPGNPNRRHSEALLVVAVKWSV